MVHSTDKTYIFDKKSKGIYNDQISEEGPFEVLSIFDIIDYIFMRSTLITKRRKSAMSTITHLLIKARGG